MSYFTSKSTWLSLVDLSESNQSNSERNEIQDRANQDYLPVFPWREITLPADVISENQEKENSTSLSAEELDYLIITRDLRHKLFFYFKEWEFGPALLEDHIHLARNESNPEEALYHYCQARHVALTLVKSNAQSNFLITFLETNRVIAEIQTLLGNYESSAMYAKEGLETIKKNKFTDKLDMRITHLMVRFLSLLGRN